MSSYFGGAVWENVADLHRCPGKQLLKGKSSPMSEDCLTVNVFRQKQDGEVNVPVAVYIHGGAFNRGNGMLWHQLLL